MRRSLLPLSSGAAGGPERGSVRGGEAARGRTAPSPPPAGRSSAPGDNRAQEGSKQGSSPWHQAYLFVHLDVQAVGHLVVLPGEKAASAGSGMASPLRRRCTSSARRHRHGRAPRGTTHMEAAFTTPSTSCCGSNTTACLGGKDGHKCRKQGAGPGPTTQIRGGAKASRCCASFDGSEEKPPSGLAPFRWNSLTMT